MTEAGLGEAELTSALDRIAAVPDFPTPGIRYWDITRCSPTPLRCARRWTRWPRGCPRSS